MSIRTFIFCDSCNPLGLRTADDGLLKNRRSSDLRTWYEGSEEDALNFGWVITADGIDLCPKCGQQGIGNMAQIKDDSTRRFVGMNRKN